MNIAIKAVPIVREPDGLAMSSRNKFLDQTQRQSALVLYRSLLKAESLLTAGCRNPSEIIAVMTEMIRAEKDAAIDYVSIVNPETMKPIDIIEKAVLIAVAVKFGKTRLIDNMNWEAR